MKAKLPKVGAWQSGESTLPMPKKFVAIDTETTGGEFRKPFVDKYTHKPFEFASMPFMVTACDHEGGTWLWEWKVDPHTRGVKVFKKDKSTIISLIKEYRCVVFHNAPFDIPALRSIGIDVPALIGWDAIHDTLPMSHVLDSGMSHKLKDMADRFLNITREDEEDLASYVERARRWCRTQGRRIPTGPGEDDNRVRTDYWLPRYVWGDEIEGKACAEYCVKDGVRTALLAHLFIKQLKKQKLWDQYCREQRQIRCSIEMTNNGLSVKTRKLATVMNTLTTTRDILEKETCQQAERLGMMMFNIRSTKQLPEFLFQKLKLPIVKLTGKRNPSTDAESLIALTEMTDLPEKSRDTVHSILDYRQANTRIGYLTSYKEKMLEDDSGVFRIHGSFNPWGTGTVRYSARNPNSQNIEKKSENAALRMVFGPPAGKEWWCIDWNQLELRLMAFASQDPTLNKVLNEGSDLHQITADLFDIPRKQGKNINFAWQYGASDSKLSKMAGVDASQFNFLMQSQFPGVVDFMQRTINQVHKHGHVQTLFGYRLSVDRDKPYTGTNYVIQGSAGDMAKNSMIAALEYIDHRKLGKDIKLVAQIHDELIFETKKGISRKAVKDLGNIMVEAGGTIGCSTPVSITRTITSWSDAKEFTFKE